MEESKKPWQSWLILVGGVLPIISPLLLVYVLELQEKLDPSSIAGMLVGFSVILLRTFSTGQPINWGIGKKKV